MISWHRKMRRWAGEMKCWRPVIRHWPRKTPYRTAKNAPWVAKKSGPHAGNPRPPREFAGPPVRNAPPVARKSAATCGNAPMERPASGRLEVRGRTLRRTQPVPGRREFCGVESGKVASPFPPRNPPGPSMPLSFQNKTSINPAILQGLRHRRPWLARQGQTGPRLPWESRAL